MTRNQFWFLLILCRKPAEKLPSRKLEYLSPQTWYAPFFYIKMFLSVLSSFFLFVPVLPFSSCSFHFFSFFSSCFLTFLNVSYYLLLFLPISYCFFLFLPFSSCFFYCIFLFLSISSFFFLFLPIWKALWKAVYGWNPWRKHKGTSEVHPGRGYLFFEPIDYICSI